MTDKSENRYHNSLVFIQQDGITYLRFDMKPVNGVLLDMYENGQLEYEVNYIDGWRQIW